MYEMLGDDFLNINNYKVMNLEKAYRLIFENAQELIEEAEILLANKKSTRAYTLSHIASEELSKLPIIFRIATDVHFGVKIDWKKENKNLRDHEGKLRRKFMQQYMLKNPLFINQINLNYIQDKAKIYNTLKNNSLYAGIHESEFCKPSQIITFEIAELNIAVVKEEMSFFEIAEFHTKGFEEALSKADKKQFLSYTFRDTD